MDPNVPSPSEAETLSAQLSERAKDAPVVAEDRETRAAQLEELSRQYVEKCRREDARRRFDVNCPDDYVESDWAHAKLAPFRPFIDRVLEYRLGPKGILATGPTGRGKSRSLWALMRRMSCEEGRDVRFYHAMEWFSQLQAQIRYGRDEAQGWVESVARRPVVFIDDFGQEAVSLAREEWSSAWFFRFLDIRVGEKRPLFITTNLRADDMVERAGRVRGDPLVRRLLDLCDPIIFETPEERALRAVGSQ